MGIKMKTKNILKGVLLWVTSLAIMSFLMGIDNLIEKNLIIYWLLLCITLLYTSYKTISEEEFMTLSGTNWFLTLIGGNDDEI